MSDEPFVDAAKAQVEGLRERKKRLMRQLISDTATAMFLERGFDEVKVSEVAEACDVSEKTIYNYFPTKESLLLDREEESTESITAHLGPGATTSPVEGTLAILNRDLEMIHRSWSEHPDMGVAYFKRFLSLVDETPSLRAASRDINERLARHAAEVMAERAGLSPDDPEPQVAAYALMGLWNVMWNALSRYVDEDLTNDEVRDRTMQDIARAARLIDSGLWSFGSVLQSGNNRDQMAAASAAAQRAGKQVITALRQAHSVWHQMQKEDNQLRKDIKKESVKEYKERMIEQRQAIKEMQEQMRRDRKALRDSLDEERKRR